MRYPGFIIAFATTLASSASGQDFSGAPIDFGIRSLGAYGTTLAGARTIVTTETSSFYIGNSTVAGTPAPAIMPTGNEYVFAQCGPAYGVYQVPQTVDCGSGNSQDNEQVALPLADFARASTVQGLATQMAAIETQVSTLNDRVNVLQQFAEANRREARQGIASALALSSPSMPSEPGRTSWTVNMGEFRGESALGAAIEHRFAATIPIAATAGITISGPNTGVRAGLAGEF